MRKIIALFLIVACFQLKVNILTTIIIDQVPFTQKLACVDCVEPIHFSTNSLPPFAQLLGNQIKVT